MLQRITVSQADNLDTLAYARIQLNKDCSIKTSGVKLSSGSLRKRPLSKTLEVLKPVPFHLHIFVQVEQHHEPASTTFGVLNKPVHLTDYYRQEYALPVLDLLTKRIHCGCVAQDRRFSRHCNFNL